MTFVFDSKVGSVQFKAVAEGGYWQMYVLVWTTWYPFDQYLPSDLGDLMRSQLTPVT